MVNMVWGSSNVSSLYLINEQVLELLSKSVSGEKVADIKCVRSQNISSALLQAPYRTFSAGNTGSSNELIVYCMPTSVSEYLAFGSEANTVRSAILSSSATVAVFDTKVIDFVGCSIDDVLSAISGDAEKKENLASAAIQALSSLDLLAASQLAGSKKQSDTVIVVGAGGREHALAVALALSPLVQKVICCPGNGGTAVEGGKISNAEGVNGKQDNNTVIELTKRVNAAMVVVGPEQPLVDGIVDAMQVECPSVRVFGPSKAAAELEASKAFTKDFLQEHGIPTAKYRNFTNAEEAIAYVESLDENDRQVVKASGLAAGKGVLIPTTKAETIAAVKEIMSDKSFGNAGDTCVIESFMTGPEASCLAFCDGKTAVLMPAAQDHKRALDNDEGLNTGGMGAYAPAPVVTPAMQKEIEAMCIKTVEKMAERGTPYVGCLYAGIM
jgi:phosphoribosylaminoimidazole carboxylase (NCAIR synthetase)